MRRKVSQFAKKIKIAIMVLDSLHLSKATIIMIIIDPPAIIKSETLEKKKLGTMAKHLCFPRNIWSLTHTFQIMLMPPLHSCSTAFSDFFQELQSDKTLGAADVQGLRTILPHRCFCWTGSSSSSPFPSLTACCGGNFTLQAYSYRMGFFMSYIGQGAAAISPYIISIIAIFIQGLLVNSYDVFKSKVKSKSCWHCHDFFVALRWSIIWFTRANRHYSILEGVGWQYSYINKASIQISADLHHRK